jgi:hypothetical protein
MVVKFRKLLELQSIKYGGVSDTLVLEHYYVLFSLLNDIQKVMIH